MRRILLAMTVSVAVHLLVVAIAVGFGLWQAAALVPALRVQPITVDVKDFPLGAPPDKAAEPDDEPPRARRPARHKVAPASEGVTIAAADAGAPPDKKDAAAPRRGAYDGGTGTGVDGGRRRPGDLRENGPEGSRLIALLRLDRLRDSPGSEVTIALIDGLLLLLPDRRRLIEGSGLDLYRDFDDLLIATPNPADDAVTFLAVRHHLTDAALRAGLDRGAKGQGKPIEWQTIAGRPVGLRRKPGLPRAPLDRDDRIIALPQASLAVMATSAYAGQLLDLDLSARPGANVDGGATDAGGAGLRKPPSRARWQTLAARIEAEEAAMPDDAAFLLMATGLFAPVAAPTGLVVPPTRGVSDDQPLQPVGGDAPPPTTMTLVAGLVEPYVEITAEFASEAEAKRWERELPAWRRKLLTNPLVFVGGLSSVIGRAESSRDGNTLRLRLATTINELQRLLNLALTLTRTAMQSR